MLTLPSVPSMTMQCADDFLHTHFPDLADSVEDYELRGNTHYYFCDDGYFVTVNKHEAALRHTERDQVMTLAHFAA